MAAAAHFQRHDFAEEEAEADELDLELELQLQLEEAQQPHSKRQPKRRQQQGKPRPRALPLSIRADDSLRERLSSGSDDDEDEDADEGARRLLGQAWSTPAPGTPNTVQPPRFLRLYISHACTAWTMRMWEFAVTLMLMAVNPGSIFVPALFTLILSLAATLCSTAIGTLLPPAPHTSLACPSPTPQPPSKTQDAAWTTRIASPPSSAPSLPPNSALGPAPFWFSSPSEVQMHSRPPPCCLSPVHPCPATAWLQTIRTLLDSGS
jgi:hypothetical protein